MTSMQKHLKLTLLSIGLIASVLATSSAYAARHLAGDHPGGGQRNSGILPPQSNPHGASYGEWSARYWQWVLAQPEGVNPQLDETGAAAAQGQSGSVWFVAATFGNSVERTLRIPSGRALFVALHPWIFGSAVFDCEPTVPGVTCDIATLRASASAAAGAATVEASIDGDPVLGMEDYRSQSPDGFSITLPSGAIFGLTPGTYQPQVSDGYWLMLAPLSTGTHVITTHVVNPLAGVDLNTTLHLIVGPGGASATAADPDLASTTRAGEKSAAAPVKKSWSQVKSIYR